MSGSLSCREAGVELLTEPRPQGKASEIVLGMTSLGGEQEAPPCRTYRSRESRLDQRNCSFIFSLKTEDGMLINITFYGSYIQDVPKILVQFSALDLIITNKCFRNLHKFLE